MSNDAQQWNEDTRSLSAEALLGGVTARFAGRVALASSMSAEDQVVTDMLCRTGQVVGIFTLDTGRLPEETYDVIEATRKRYGVQIKVLFPDARDVERMVNQHGPNLFRQSVAFRKECCRVRKVLPLRRELATLDAWLTGLRREQAGTRIGLQRIEWDDGNGLYKISPLADWTTQAVWEYIRAHDVPYNRLHDRGYPSIGCAPCTRAVGPGEDIRAGRWWWELPEHKECGLHADGGKLVRKEG